MAKNPMSKKTLNNNKWKQKEASKDKAQKRKNSDRKSKAEKKRADAESKRMIMEAKADVSAKRKAAAMEATKQTGKTARTAAIADAAARSAEAYANRMASLDALNSVINNSMDKDGTSDGGSTSKTFQENENSGVVKDNRGEKLE